MHVTCAGCDLLLHRPYTNLSKNAYNKVLRIAVSQRSLGVTIINRLGLYMKNDKKQKQSLT